MADNYIHSHTIELAGIPLSIKLEHKSAVDFFSAFEVYGRDSAATLSVTEYDWQEMKNLGFTRNGQTEVSILTAFASDELLKYNRLIIHAVAFSFQGQAWLIAAPPRVGKSTQIKYLMNLFPNEFSVICGDRPILQLMDDNSFFVHPSPWNGKENWKGAPAAPLAGILCLQRDNETRIRKLKPKDAVIPVFAAIISTRESEEQIKKIAELETIILQNVPVYEFHNGGVPDSTKTLYQFLTKGEESHEI